MAERAPVTEARRIPVKVEPQYPPDPALADEARAAKNWAEMDPKLKLRIKEADRAAVRTVREVLAKTAAT